MNQAENERAKTGKLSGAIYSSEREFTKDCEEAMQMFAKETTLKPEMYKSVQQFENFIADFTLKLFRATEESIAITTYGGTDSIANAVLTYKLKYLKRGIV